MEDIDRIKHVIPLPGERRTPNQPGEGWSQIWPAAMAGVQRGVVALAGPFKFHSVSLCGRLYPLPRRTTFRFRNALHLIEARNSVAYVGGIF